MESDADLVRRCLDGNRAAWAALVARHADLAYGVLRRAGLEAAAADDAFQEVCVLLWKGLAKLREAERLAPWLVVTAKRVAWRMRRRAKARRRREEARARPEVDPAASPEAELAALEDEQAVREALGAMGERCRRLLTALYFEASDGGYDEIARRLGMPRGSIGPTRRRCLETLRAELAARGLESDVSDNPAAASSPLTPRSRRRGDRKGPS